eukprot:GHVU01004117.1.p1 GENE.GHVU01004117.1~~GHVU01004117.1.p1  ORF type:complete len:104 (+),score=3.34 GHVU01004117.1:853-1164(+)
MQVDGAGMEDKEGKKSFALRVRFYADGDLHDFHVANIQAEGESLTVSVHLITLCWWLTSWTPWTRTGISRSSCTRPTGPPSWLVLMLVSPVQYYLTYNGQDNL